MSKTNFRVVQLLYAEIRHSDWSNPLTRLTAANQSGLFLRRVATELLNLFMRSAPGPYSVKKFTATIYAKHIFNFSVKMFNKFILSFDDLNKFQLNLTMVKKHSDWM